MFAYIISGIFCALFLVALLLYLQCLKKLSLSREETIHAQAELNSLKVQLDSERNFTSESMKTLENQFKGFAATALEGNTRQFLELARATFQKETQTSTQQMSEKHKAINDLVKPLNDTLNTYNEHIKEIEKERQKSYTKVEEELKRVAIAGSQLSQETAALKNALKRPHVRGRWGEVQLMNCIELAGMSEYADINTQDSQLDDDGNRLTPDMTVKMPGGRVVLVDAKTPIDAFLIYLDATTDESKKLELLRHGRLIREHVTKLGQKDYGARFKDSGDFTVMFLPNESFLYAALESQPDLMEYALNKKILIATPPTLIGLLKVISFGWNEKKLAQNAQAISEAGKEFHKRIVDFVEAFTSIGEALERAQKQYEIGVSRLKSRVIIQATRLEKLGAKSKKDLPLGLVLEDLSDPLEADDLTEEVPSV